VYHVAQVNLQEFAPDWRPISLPRPVALEELATPALLLHVDAMEENLAKMAEHGQRSRKGLRPHTKTHKCPLIARRQLEAGAVGLCCAKISEAEVMVAAGIESVLVTSPVVSPEKVRRVVELSRQAPELAVVVDSDLGVDRLAEAASSAGVEVAVLVDLDVGTHRTGIAPGAPALALARRIDRLPGLRFCGLQAYAGHLMHVPGHEQRRTSSHRALADAVETRRLLEADGLPVRILTGGGTGTWDIDSEVEAMTDLQVGSYLFMDVQYLRIGDRLGDRFAAFRPALTLLVTAISQPVPQLITVDAGFKAFASEEAAPTARNVDGVVYHFAGDEHGILELKAPSRPVRLGDKLEFLTPHCDPTVNLHDVYHVVRDGVVEELWPIAARGCGQ